MNISTEPKLKLPTLQDVVSKNIEDFSVTLILAFDQFGFLSPHLSVGLGEVECVDFGVSPWHTDSLMLQS